MASPVVAPVADPIIDTVHDIELQVLGFAEGFVDQTEIKAVTDSAFSFVRSVFDAQRDVSRKVVDAVDNTIHTVSSTVEGAMPGNGDAKAPKPAPAKAAAAKRA
ncbi:MAG: hypothetical protein U0U69_09425 [Acidimicrobiia bacterium]